MSHQHFALQSKHTEIYISTANGIGKPCMLFICDDIIRFDSTTGKELDCCFSRKLGPVYTSLF